MKGGILTKRTTVWRGLALVLAILLGLLSTVPGLAQTGPDSLNFQGRLMDSSGTPRGGETHCVRVRLCSDSGCSTQVWPGSGYEYHLVTTESGTYKAGLFTLAVGSSISVPPSLMYDHDTLYLEIGVSDAGGECDGVGETYTVMEPRSQLRASAYAQRSRRVHTSEADNTWLVDVRNTGSGGAILGMSTASTGVYGRGTLGVYGEGSQYGVHGYTDAASAYGVYGEAEAATGVYGIGPIAGVRGQSATTTGRGVYGQASGNSGVNYGVYGVSNSPAGYAVYGSAPTTGVYGQASATSGLNYGVYGSSSSADGIGVYGINPNDTGVYGEGQLGVGGWGFHGVVGESDSTGGYGVSGYASATSGTNYGVFGWSDSPAGYAVYGIAPTYGVYGEAEASTGASRGVQGLIYSTGDDARAGSFQALGNSGATYGLYATNNSTTNGATAGYFYADGDTGVTYGLHATNDSTSDGAAAGTFHANGDSGATYGLYTTNDSTTSGATAGAFLAAGSSGATRAVRAENNSTSNDARAGSFHALGSSGQTYGVYAQNASTTDGARAGHFYASGASGATYGLYASNASTSNNASAGYFHATGTQGATRGLYAQIDSTTDNAKAAHFVANGLTGETYGLYVENYNEEFGTGAYIYSEGTTGLEVETDNVDLATAGRFWASSSYGIATGVFASSDSSVLNSSAGWFTQDGGNNRTYGVHADVSGWARGTAAGYFESQGYSGRTYGVYVQNNTQEYSQADPSYGLYSWMASCTTQQGCYGVYTPNRMYAAVLDTLSSDVAEYFPAEGDLPPGSVVMVDPRGGGGLVLAEGAYNTAVAGIISTQPGVALGTGEREGGDGDKNQVLLALVGRVPCKVSAENGPIRPGDLLTTSSIPGHAMRAEAVEVNGVLFHRPGTIIGKALEGWDKGTGTILVLVTLQ